MVSNSAMPTTSSGAIHCGLGPIQQNQLKNLNREILRACQAYNSTPRPFARAACGDAGSTSFTQENVTNETFSPHFNRSTGASKSFNFAQQVATPNNTTKNYALAPNQHQMSQSASASPKFVHKQYNSPLDLYSMDNIRKTIEAHSEQIAPGVMGINFLKNEQNSQQSLKQSAVYQLVREEEEKEARHRRIGSSADLPTTPPRSIDATTMQSQPATLVVLQGTPRPPKQPQFYQHQHQQQPHQYQYKQQQLATPDTTGRTKVLLTPSQCLNNVSSVAAKHQLIKRPQLPLPPQFHHQLPTHQQQQEKTAIKDIKQLPPLIESIADSPICLSCGHSIVGVYARVGSGTLHPECFNCATCGTSLKNTGHFTVNDKIYCDIHARQVAALIFGVRELPSGDASSVSIGDSSVNSAPVGAESSRITKPQLVSTSTRRFEASATRTMSTNWTSTPSSKATTSSSLTKNIGAGNNSVSLSTSTSTSTSNQDQLPVCAGCKSKIRGTYVSAAESNWCRTCADGVFRCANCACSLLDAQPFVENANDKRYYCSSCFDTFLAPTCAKCAAKIRADCVTALDKTWHPNCFNCAQCKQQFNNSSFYLEDGLAYCERDWNELFTAKCFSCRQPIAAGDRWIEALERRYHAACFVCGSCNTPLEGAHFYHKNGVPLCTLHM